MADAKWNKFFEVLEKECKKLGYNGHIDKAEFEHAFYNNKDPKKEAKAFVDGLDRAGSGS